MNKKKSFYAGFVSLALMSFLPVALNASGAADTASKAVNAAMTGMTVNFTIAQVNEKACPGSPPSCVIAVMAGASTVFLAGDTVPKSMDISDQASCASILDPVLCNSNSGELGGGDSNFADGNFSGAGSNTGLNLSVGEYQKALGAAASVKGGAEKILASLKEKGYSMDLNSQTVSTPKGNFSASAIGNTQAMLDAGFSLDEIQQMKELMDSAGKINTDKALANLGLDFMSSGAKAYKKKTRVSSNSSNSIDNLLKQLQSQASANSKAGLGNTNPLARNIASGEKIGASNANIFKMVQRRYQIKSAEKGFVTEP